MQTCTETLTLWMAGLGLAHMHMALQDWGCDMRVGTDADEAAE